MPLISMREMLDHAAEAGYGIPAFNVNNLEQVQAVILAKMERNGNVTERMRRDVAENVWHDSLVNWARSFQ